jgi:hypothetical protein
MLTRFEVHPTVKIAAYALSIAIVVSFGIVGEKRLFRSNVPAAPALAKAACVLSAPLRLTVISH